MLELKSPRKHTYDAISHDLCLLLLCFMSIFLPILLWFFSGGSSPFNATHLVFPGSVRQCLSPHHIIQWIRFGLADIDILEILSSSYDSVRPMEVVMNIFMAILLFPPVSIASLTQITRHFRSPDVLRLRSAKFERGLIAVLIFLVAYSVFIAVWVGLAYVFFRRTGWILQGCLFINDWYHDCVSLGSLSPLLFGIFGYLLASPIFGNKKGIWRVLLLTGISVWHISIYKAHFWYGTVSFAIGFIFGVVIAGRMVNVDRKAVLFFVMILCMFIAASYARGMGSDAPVIPDRHSHRESTSTHPFISIVIPSAPRPESPLYLLDTVSSYLEQLPDVGTYDDDVDVAMFKIIVVGTGGEWSDASENAVLDAAKLVFAANSKGKAYVSFNTSSAVNSDILRDVAGYSAANGELPNYISLDIASSLLIGYESGAEYVMLGEDDFPLCDSAWKSIIKLVNVSMVESGLADTCAFHVGMGGSGVIIPRKHVPAMLNALLIPTMQDTGEPVASDIRMLQCATGAEAEEYPACKGCRLVVPPRMQMRHIGIQSSLGHIDYIEDPNRWQCGWRHFMNGVANVIVVNTDGLGS